MRPWVIANSSHTGSGFIIADRLIATNAAAHVAEHGKVLTLRKQADGRRFPARVVALASQVDLAFLTVDDEEFWSNAFVLQISPKLVRFQDQVHVIGYPSGGDSICITEGVVSRLDWKTSRCRDQQRELWGTLHFRRQSLRRCLPGNEKCSECRLHYPIEHPASAQDGRRSEQSRSHSSSQCGHLCN
jgi:hypothetical protein